MYIRELDSKSGASLKLTILNPKGRIWTMVAGGGASVIYRSVVHALCVMKPNLFVVMDPSLFFFFSLLAPSLIVDFSFFCSFLSDTICDLGGASDLANYGEYSGAPR